jgi:hypothetical protein
MLCPGLLHIDRCYDADQDSVRLLAVQCCGPLARALSKSECLTSVVPVVQRFAQVSFMNTYAMIFFSYPANCYAYCPVCGDDRTSPGVYDTMWRNNYTCCALRLEQNLPGTVRWLEHDVCGFF